MLGQRLFWDMRLSRDGQTACASCHFREAYGADTRVQSTDARGKLTRFHSMTIFNTQQQRRTRWLADRNSGAAQAIGSVTGSMGFDERTELLPLLQGYRLCAAFEAAFPEPGIAVSRSAAVQRRGLPAQLAYSGTVRSVARR
ncbi:MAG: cytochrome-c peroxidase [Woeseiaceae bacterium]|nr:cytochrome-c peroxidase [Woeseiaceae bacterium]